MIKKTEDELDDLETSKKRLNQWYKKSEAVKDLHTTLIRLLNELTPWEPKLIKAYQRNRLRLKKEFEVFKNYPEYSNFMREECTSLSSGGNLGLRLEESRPARHDDLELRFPWGLGGTMTELPNEPVTERLVPHISHNRHKPVESFSRGYLDQCDTSKIDGKLKNSTLIPILLVKNAGHKVTLMKKPATTGISFESADGEIVNVHSSDHSQK